MKKHVVGLRRLERAHLDRLGEVFHVDYFESIDDANRTQFMQALARAHGLIGAKLDVTAAMIAAAPELEAIATISAGYDNLPVADIHARQIVLCNTPDALTETTADLGFALILGCARRLWSCTITCDKAIGAPMSAIVCWAPTCTANPWACSAWAGSAPRSRGAARSASA